MTHYSIEPNTRKYVIKWYGFLSFTKNLCNKHGNQLLNTATKTGINASKKVVHKTAEATGRFLGN